MEAARTLIVLEILDELMERDLRRQRVYRDKCNPFDQSEEEFINYFRMSKSTAWYVIESLRNDLSNRSISRHALSPEEKVLCALLFYGSGTYQRFAGNDRYLGLSQSSVSRCVNDVSSAINSKMLPLWIQFFSSKEHQSKTKMEFNLKFGFPGIIGAIDCTHVAIVAPNNTQEYQSSIYMNTKSFFSINVQIICDVNMRILNINAKYPGSTQAAFIWRHSAIRNALLANNEAGSWLIGDSGYPLEPWLMTPISNADEDSSSARYNYAHTQARNTIEQCIVLLKSRFRCCQRSRQLHYSPEKAGLIINACAVLHNICIHHNVRHFPIEELDEDIAWGPIPQDNGTNSLRDNAVALRNSLLMTRFS
ncbi:Putative nuclease HARBI1 [Araneus ventricosus]|uniref:Nuclease HARBI1 n=1 Tax=Araneus ventricosus TaxID=182803 RepID=A0A4Y2JM73_ARAVE|nr:Putative nuclease HARBI1 [Araneus ventricosus]